MMTLNTKIQYFLVPLMSEGKPNKVLFDDLHGLLIKSLFLTKYTSLG